MKIMKKYERSGVPCVYDEINNDPCDLLDVLRPLTLQEQIDKVYSISGKLEFTRRQELADLRGMIIDDPEDYESPLDTYKQPSLVDVVNSQLELNRKIDDLMKVEKIVSPKQAKSVVKPSNNEEADSQQKTQEKTE